jgi:hypothetical protein
MKANKLLRLEYECNEKWDEMKGNEKIRHCSHCNRFVNNLDELTLKEVRKLALSSEGKICVRYRNYTLNDKPPFTRRFARAAANAGLVAGAIGAAFGGVASAAGTVNEPVKIYRMKNSERTPATGGRIFGTITDAQDAVIPFAVVTLVQVGLGEIRIVNASSDGQYEFTDLPAGRYLVKVTASGFAPGSTYEFELSEDSEVKRDLRLGVAEVSISLDVVSELKLEDTVVMGILAVNLTHYPLVSAVINDDLEEVKARVAMGEKINVRDKGWDGMSPLHFAVQNGNIDIAKFLLERGAKVNLKDKLKRTPLMMIDSDATPELVQLLINYGSKLNNADAEGKTVLHHISGSNVDAGIIRMLIAYGININAVDNEGNTPLIAAAEMNDKNMLNILLESGADTRHRNRNGKTAADITDSAEIRQILNSYGLASN